MKGFIPFKDLTPSKYERIKMDVQKVWDRMKFMERRADALREELDEKSKMLETLEGRVKIFARKLKEIEDDELLDALFSADEMIEH